MNNSNLNEKVDCYRFLLLYIKISEETYYQRNRKTILNRAKKYYSDNNEVLKERAINKYRELSEEEKKIKIKYGRNRCHNSSDEKKQSLR